MKQEQITLLLVDDHAIVRAGYRQLISTTPDIVVIGESAAAEEACQQYDELQPDVVVMDLNLPGMSGLEAIRRLISKAPSAAILAFTMHDELAYVHRALEAGAKGYLTKSCDPDLLIEGVYALAKGENYIEPVLAEALLKSEAASKVITKNGLEELSPREFDVFCLLAEGKACKQAASTLFLSEKTVSNYATKIKNKLGVRTLPELTRIAYQEGIAIV
ncbi:MAG: DNA-binding response regulator [uncultured Thiotrichaceae bacterium]|uniref:DNA-binding response regulator n=1 Tax=uncultured Thiotrichaceae bacterium TaxID=298394 RepID=A0A6S6TWI0_9GAMM|nr:MAG: DNA-binding response regulator [uncultured Thiotrichaceae bacterium]